VAHDEYLRRNLIHASAVGLKSGLIALINRVDTRPDFPRWLRDGLQGSLDRAKKLPGPVAQWRNNAHDAPLRAAQDAILINHAGVVMGGLRVTEHDLIVHYGGGYFARTQEMVDGRWVFRQPETIYERRDLEVV
jgi:hypothetical protein